MGQMIEGVWHREEIRPADVGGTFVRPQTSFRHRIEPGGAFPPEPGRYHLYASLACPWAHRALIFRKLKGLEPLVGLSVTHWLMRDDGWTFEAGEGVIPDPMGAHCLHEVYARSDRHYSGRVTVPVLWDGASKTIVNNESSEIIRLFNAAFDQCGANPGNYYPERQRQQIDAVNARVYETLNNGVYLAGFATTQQAYEAAVHPLFETLDWLEQVLSRSEFVCGKVATEADWRLFTTLLRFDAVYHGHFKCNFRRIVDYPNLWSYTKRLYHVPGVAETVDFVHIKRHYYMSHRHVNPSGIVPAGPALIF